MNNFNSLLNETFIFRPTDAQSDGVIITPDHYHPLGQGKLRYADGKWIPDDGKPDLAFVYGVVAYGVSLPYSTNVLWSWRDMELECKYLPEELAKYHARGWHYQTVNNTHWEDYRWDKRDDHPNELAFRSAMKKCCSIHGCANGRGPDLLQPNIWIERELLWVKSTMQLVKAPDYPVCFLCLDGGKGHLLNALRDKKSDLEAEITYDWEAHQKAEIDAIDYKDSAETAEERLKDIEQQIGALA